jgi:Fe-S-cluster-containing dehydrogenase component
MAPIKSFIVDPQRCIGCRSCMAACRECDSHKGMSMIYVDFIDRVESTLTLPSVCMHCEDPACAKVCPADAIKVGPDGVVHMAQTERCLSCLNCVYACPFGIPKIEPAQHLQYKCNLCYDRTAFGKAPMCTTVCPSGALTYGEFADIIGSRSGRPINTFAFGEQEVKTRVYLMMPASVEAGELDITGVEQEDAEIASPLQFLEDALLVRNEE